MRTAEVAQFDFGGFVILIRVDLDVVGLILLDLGLSVFVNMWLV